jgi:hypothetical protein
MATSPIYSWPEPDNTDLVKNGALAIRTLGNAIDTTMGTMVAKTIIDAKGDLIAGTAADTAARLAVGNNGETLVADSSASTGLRYTGNFAAGKNKIINGNFYINQRQFTTTTVSGTYGFDRFPWSGAGSGTQSYSAQTFTAGTAPVSGYESANFARITTSSQNATDSRVDFDTNIEDVRTFAGETTTISFWAKAASGTPKVAVEIVQVFGSGGSPSAFNPVYVAQVTLSTSWARYSVTTTVPSLSGKTVGTTAPGYLGLNLWVSAGTTYNSRSGSLGAQNNTFDFWGVQWEAGSVATAFQTATGTIQGELAACQRYYYRNTATEVAAQFAIGTGSSTTQVDLMVTLPVAMRVRPQSAEYSGLAVIDSANPGIAVVTAALFKGTPTTAYFYVSSLTGVTQYRPYFLQSNTTSGYLGFSAEL